MAFGNSKNAFQSRKWKRMKDCACYCFSKHGLLKLYRSCKSMSPGLNQYCESIVPLKKKKNQCIWKITWFHVQNQIAASFEKSDLTTLTFSPAAYMANGNGCIFYREFNFFKNNFLHPFAMALRFLTHLPMAFSWHLDSLTICRYYLALFMLIAVIKSFSLTQKSCALCQHPQNWGRLTCYFVKRVKYQPLYIVLDQSVSSFPMYPTSFSCHISLARISSIMLNRSDRRKHPCLAPDLGWGGAFSFLPVNMI